MALKGIKQTKEHLEKRIKSIKDGGKLKLKRIPRSEETKQKISKSNKGTKPSKSAIENSVKARKGISLTKEHKKKIGRSGKDSGSWKGGITKDINKYAVNYRKKQKEKLAGREMPEQCEICGVLTCDLKRGLCYDHNHKTGEFRGWICTRCNTAIGLASENTETLLAMIDYIKNNGIKSINGLE